MYRVVDLPRSSAMRTPRIAVWLLLACGLAAHRTAVAQPADPTLPQLHHTAWTLRDGAPSDVLALAQTVDGYLWLGTSAGVYRFDGVEFDRIVFRGGTQPTSQNVASMLALADGTLCIGYRFGGIGFYANGALRYFGAADGAPTSTVHGLAVDSAGVIWAASNEGVFRLTRDRWTHVATTDGLPTGVARHVMVDRSGTLWVTVLGAGLFTRTRGAVKFVLQSSVGAIEHASYGLAVTPSGDVWLAVLSGSTMRLVSGASGKAVRLRRPSGEYTGDIFAARDSSLWLATTNGIERIRARHDTLHAAPTPEVDAFTATSGLSGSLLLAMITDREGSIWSGTEGGLDRFRRAKLEKLALPDRSASPALAPAERGGLVVGSMYGPTVLIDQSARRRSLNLPLVQAMYREPSGRLWLGSDVGRLWHSDGDRFVEDATPAGLSLVPIQAIATDDAGDLWISVVRTGVFRRSGGKWQLYGGLPTLPKLTAIRLATDSSGALWLGYTENRLARLAHGVVTQWSARDGLSVGNISAILVARNHVWIGGEGGLLRLDGERFMPVDANADAPFRAVSGIVESASGELWMNGADGITRIGAVELDSARRNATHRVAFERFDTRDGLDGVAPQLRPLPTAFVASDGALLFTTNRGVFRIDPANVRRNRIVPPVRIHALIANGIRHAPADTITLPPGTSSLQVRYTALSLGIPERVRFRYQLVGSDTGWQDAGARRDAFYTNLSPGRYRFRVLASNDDAVWNESGASLAFTIAPTFWQTPAFVLLCIVAAVALAVVAYRMRVSSVSGALRDRYEVRLAERTRIAQDLHDTLLQGFTGITLQLQSVKRSIAAQNGQAAGALESILSEADTTLRDARHAVWDLRPPELDSADVVAALEAFARATLERDTCRLQCIVTGDRRRLPGEIEVAALRVGREAIANVVQHAGARCVTLNVRFDAHELVVRILDDGRGFDASVVDGASQRGHWGIVGMRERAERLHGSLTMTQPVSGGTEVCLSLPIR